MVSEDTVVTKFSSKTGSSGVLVLEQLPFKDKSNSLVVVSVGGISVSSASNQIYK